MVRWRLKDKIKAFFSSLLLALLEWGIIASVYLFLFQVKSVIELWTYFFSFSSPFWAAYWRRRGCKLLMLRHFMLSRWGCDTFFASHRRRKLISRVNHQSAAVRMKLFESSTRLAGNCSQFEASSRWYDEITYCKSEKEREREVEWKVWKRL